RFSRCSASRSAIWNRAAVGALPVKLPAPGLRRVLRRSLAALVGVGVSARLAFYLLDFHAVFECFQNAARTSNDFLTLFDTAENLDIILASDPGSHFDKSDFAVFEQIHAFEALGFLSARRRRSVARDAGSG